MVQEQQFRNTHDLLFSWREWHLVYFVWNSPLQLCLDFTIQLIWVATLIFAKHKAKETIIEYLLLQSVVNQLCSNDSFFRISMNHTNKLSPSPSVVHKCTQTWEHTVFPHILDENTVWSHYLKLSWPLHIFRCVKMQFQKPAMPWSERHCFYATKKNMA